MNSTKLNLTNIKVNKVDNVDNVIPNDLSPQIIGLLYILNNNYLKNKH